MNSEEVKQINDKYIQEQLCVRYKQSFSKNKSKNL